MQSQTVNASGGFVFWTAATWSNQALLKSRMDSISLGDYAPKPMAREVALREALEEVMGEGKRGRLVRPLAESGGFCVVEEVKGADANAYQQVLMAKLVGSTLLFRPFDQEQADKIANAFNQMLGRVPGAAVGQALVSLVKKMSGIAIRQTGGLYWLPAKHASEWRQIADAVEGASVHGGSRVYLATMEVNADSIRVVRDAIKSEIVKESERLLAEAVKGELGKKALDARLAYISQLEEKVKEYEGIVGESLEDLRESLGRTSAALGMVAMDALCPQEGAAA